jgi:hypothetical protein
MEYILKTTKILNGIKEVKNYPCIDLNWRVDGSCILFVKYGEHQYFEDIISYERMKNTVENLVSYIISYIEKQFKTK